MPSYPSTRKYVEKSLATTLDWAEREKSLLPIISIRHFSGVQGIFEDLREKIRFGAKCNGFFRLRMN